MLRFGGEIESAGHSLVRVSERSEMKKNMKVTLAMAILMVELVILAVIGPLRIDRALSVCRFLYQEDKSSAIGAHFQEQRGPEEQCKNGMIYVYELPGEFNEDLIRDCHSLNPWKSMCSTISNFGLGPKISFASTGFLHRFLILLSISSSGARDEDYRLWPAKSSWYSTDQYSAEIFFHKRMLEYRCRTHDRDKATAFYIPFYAGLDISRHLWSQVHESSKARALDSLSEQLLQWLEGQPSFVRTGGTNHFFMVGRASWDFRRMPHAISDWGSSLFHREQMKNITKLVVERSPWDESEIGVPYPTPFHPSSDSELHQWLAFVKNSPRVNLFAFAGSPRPGYKDDFRQLMVDECRAAVNQGYRAVCMSCTTGSDNAAACRQDPLKVTRLFLTSVFCLQPRGDSFTRKSVFDSLLAGCIPVLFWKQSAYWQYQLYLPGEAESYSVFIPHGDVRNGSRVLDVLNRIKGESVRRMQVEVLKIVPGILYSSSSTTSRYWNDALDIGVQGVLERMKKSGR